MKKLFIAVVALFVGSQFYHYSPFYPTVIHAVAVVYPTQENSTRGIVTFTQQPDGIAVTAQISGLTPGEHGFHIHEFGDCSSTDCSGAGSHFNPMSHQHGGPDQRIRHVGDLGNIVADANGSATYSSIDRRLSLNGLHSIIGRSVIVHAQGDDFTTQPTGNAGARVGCGVIGIGPPSLR